MKIVNTGARLWKSYPKCGWNIVFKVHEGSVRKYLETSLRIADEYPSIFVSYESSFLNLAYLFNHP